MRRPSFNTTRLITTSSAAIALAVCSTNSQAQQASVSESALQAEEAEASEPLEINTVFEDYDAASLALSPESKAYRGIRDADYGLWDDVSDDEAEAEFLLLEVTAKALKTDFADATLSDQDDLSYRLFEQLAQRRKSLQPYREYRFLFDHRSGAHTRIPAFLINIHRVSEPAHADAYISRIQGIGPLLDALNTQAHERSDEGIMPPDWVYPYVISDLEALIGKGMDNAVLADFNGKVDALKEPAADKARMKAKAANAWQTSARPAYQRLLAEMRRQQKIAPTDDGIWRLPDGDKYYAALLGSYTTTDLTADEIHNIGLREVNRIHGEMRKIMAQVGFEGTLQDFFEFTRTGDQFFYTTREEYLADSQAAIDRLTVKLPDFFGVLPEAPLTIKAVEAFREKSAGKAFYQGPAPDGSRPGTYYVNLYNLRDMSKNELEALAYHEGLPGHHLQRTIQTELGDLPAFRRFGGVTAYTEGWGLYSEELGKDMGFYTDPYSDFGRLGMELWRACRLVVDTGIHSKRWSRERAIEYLQVNTPNPEGDIVKAIERYIVTPGQATAYMIGKLKIIELRTKARNELGDDFDIRGFHDVVLTSGPVPLSILDENVTKWIEETKQGG